MPYITIKEAVNLTGKSEKTIRRLINTEGSKPYVTNEDGKLLIEISYLQQHYPLVNHGQTQENTPRQTLDTSTQLSIDTKNPQNTVSLQHEIDLLKQELRHKDELAREKDLRIEVLERSLLLLGEGLKKEPVIDPQQPEPETSAPTKKKRWWHL